MLRPIPFAQARRLLAVRRNPSRSDQTSRGFLLTAPGGRIPAAGQRIHGLEPKGGQPIDQPFCQAMLQQTCPSSNQPANQRIYQPSRRPINQHTTQSINQPANVPNKQPTVPIGHHTGHPDNQPTCRSANHSSYQPTSALHKRPTCQLTTQPATQSSN